MICTEIDCENKVHSKGLCQKHYRRLSRKGTTAAVGYEKIGQTKHPLYHVYKNMFKRCDNQNDPHYKNYGARGITICDRWRGVKGFSNFISDMGERPEATSLDRINNDGNYEPANCRWATKSQQQLNRRSVRVARIKDAYKSINK